MWQTTPLQPVGAGPARPGPGPDKGGPGPAPPHKAWGGVEAEPGAVENCPALPHVAEPRDGKAGRTPALPRAAPPPACPQAGKSRAPHMRGKPKARRAMRGTADTPPHRPARHTGVCLAPGRGGSGALPHEAGRQSRARHGRAALRSKAMPLAAQRGSRSPLPLGMASSPCARARHPFRVTRE